MLPPGWLGNHTRTTTRAYRCEQCRGVCLVVLVYAPGEYPIRCQNPAPKAVNQLCGHVHTVRLYPSANPIGGDVV